MKEINRTAPRVFRLLNAFFQGILAWCRALPEVVPITPGNLQRPLKIGQRRLVIGGKVIIVTVKT